MFSISFLPIQNYSKFSEMIQKFKRPYGWNSWTVWLPICRLKIVEVKTDRITGSCYTAARTAINYWCRGSQEETHNPFKFITGPCGHLLGWMRITRWFLTAQGPASCFSNSRGSNKDASSCTVASNKTLSMLRTLLSTCDVSMSQLNWSWEIVRNQSILSVHEIFEAQWRIFKPRRS
jgi:hypothetical protein